MAIQKERYDIIARRRFEDDSDDVALFTGAAVPSTFTLRPADADADVAEKQEEEVDELGRSKRDELAPRSTTRTARRAARERRRAARPPSLETGEEDSGTFTDDDLSTSDAADLSHALTGLRESLEGVFSDVKAEDFRDPNRGIRRRFEEWRERFGEEYRHAFGGLALVGVWEFWARVEMALWNPFEVS